MTGDGVNDAPSSREADCGIAVEGASEELQSSQTPHLTMSSTRTKHLSTRRWSVEEADYRIAVEGASEAAQPAADIVFLAPGLSTIVLAIIVLAIMIARQISRRIKAYVQDRFAPCLPRYVYNYHQRDRPLRPHRLHCPLRRSGLATVAVAYDSSPGSDASRKQVVEDLDHLSKLVIEPAMATRSIRRYVSNGSIIQA